MNPRLNLIVPNVYWGMGLDYECDLLCVTPSGYATEIELKVSKGDIKKDLIKRHQHDSKIIRRFFYGVPWSLKDCDLIPVDAGIIAAKPDDCWGSVKIIRPARVNKFSRKITEGERFKLMELGCMRIWGLKQKIFQMRRPCRPCEQPTTTVL